MWIVSAMPSSVSLVAVVVKAPSTMISLSVMSRSRSSCAVCVSSASSAGFPIWLVGGRMNPRAPVLVFAGDHAELIDVPELGRLFGLNRPGFDGGSGVLISGQDLVGRGGQRRSFVVSFWVVDVCERACPGGGGGGSARGEAATATAAGLGS
jgi:hypothetical protein